MSPAIRLSEAQLIALVASSALWAVLEKRDSLDLYDTLCPVFVKGIATLDLDERTRVVLELFQHAKEKHGKV